MRGELRRKTLSDFEPQAPAQAPEKRASASNAPQGKGWVSDLLRRASQDPDAAVLGGKDVAGIVAAEEAQIEKMRRRQQQE